MYIMTVLFFGLIHWGVLFPPPQRELVGTTTVVSRVPNYVFYAPPGALSNGTCFANYTPIVLKLDGTSDGVQVHSEYATFMDFTSFTVFAALPSARSDDVCYFLLNQTWQLWRYSDGRTVWFQAELVSCSTVGGGASRIDTTRYINSRGMWVENKTGEQSPYGLQWNLTQGTTKEVTIECTQKEFVPLGAGYLVDILGHDVHIGVSISIGRSFNNTYVFNNNMTSLDVQMMCNGLITQVSPTFYKTEGALIWFSE